ncbi:MAG: NAD+ synthase [Planctomycetaceae bacterium]|nr:NAD+ synthase [Planctomycetaceae bacterium]
MKIALAQFNPIVGDIVGNLDRSRKLIAQAADAGARLVVFGELSLVGYPPRDLLRKERFVADSEAAAASLARTCTQTAALVGFVRRNPAASGRPLQNCAALLSEGKIQHIYAKALLPTYDVFDETRYFEPGPDHPCLEIAGGRLGLSICEDLWDSASLGRALYERDPIAQLRSCGADIIINMAASPYQMGKPRLREELFARRAAAAKAAIVYVNQVGGNDELVFDGGSAVIGPDGSVVARAKSFEEDLLVVETADLGASRRETPAEEIDSLWSALKLGLRDYVRKCGFSSVVLGLSGGIDSALVAALGAEALGPDNVHALAMPSRYSSDHSLADAQALARALGIHYRVLPIEGVHAAYEQALGEVLAGGWEEIAYENVQARIRGAMVMAASNARGHMALATGNKSELSVGYCTLYGDMCGGLAPIGDVLKTQIYTLARRINARAGREVIPQSTIDKAPSAELKPNQTDQDKLPPYDVLDAILQRYIEGEKTALQIIDEGFDAQTVHRVVAMVDSAEHKRRQAAPVLKVTARAFGSGRRMPIAQRYIPQAGEF